MNISENREDVTCGYVRGLYNGIENVLTNKCVSEVCACEEKHPSAITKNMHNDKNSPEGKGLERELVNLMHTAQVTRITEKRLTWTNNTIHREPKNTELIKPYEVNVFE